MNWETLLRYGYGHHLVYTQDALLRAWARDEIRAGMQWLVEELRFEAYARMRADDDGMASI